MKKTIDITAIPELGTSVGMQGSAKQSPVLNMPVLAAVIVGIIIGI